MTKKEMEVVKGLFFFASLFSSMFMCVQCSRASNLASNPSPQPGSVPTVVKGLDLQRYMGRWYQIAAYPTIFNPKNAMDVRATYTLKEDGTVDVLNESWVDGKESSIDGTAYKADPSSDEAKLKVKFYVPPFLPIIPVVGDYWILYLDADYQYAIVGGPSRKYLWILSRKTHIDDQFYSQLLQKATEEGYDVSKLQKTPQGAPPPE